MNENELYKLDYAINSNNVGKISYLINHKAFLYSLVLTFLTLFVLFTFFHYYSYSILILYTTLGIILYLSIDSHANKLNSNWKLPSYFIYVSYILFFVFFAISLLYLKFLDALYEKSFWYYFLIGICSLCIFISSILNKNRKLEYLMPVVILYMGLNIFLSNYIVFPSGVYASGDTHYQIYNIILPILQNGKIPSNEGYSFFPLHQILIVMLSSIVGINSIIIYKFIIGVFYAFSSLFIYSLGKRLIGQTFGILSMLLYVIAPEIVYHATHAYQYSYALVIGILMLYLYEYLNNKVNNTKISWSILSILVFISLTWTHQFTSTVIFVLIIIYNLARMLHSKVLYMENTFYSKLLLLFILVLFAHWIYVSFTFSSLIRVADIYYSSLFAPENYQSSVANQIISSTTQSLWTIILNISAKGILFMLATLGSLYGLSKENSHVMVWSVWAIFIFSLVSAGSVIHMPMLLAGRMLALFWAISIVYLAGLGIIVLINQYGNKALVLCCLLILMLPILSLGSMSAGTETSLFRDDYPSERLYDTESDSYLYSWAKTSVPNESNILISKSWVPEYYDTMRIYNQLPITENDLIDVDSLSFGDFIVLNQKDTTGFRIRGISEIQQIKSITLEDNMTTTEASSNYMRDTKLNVSNLKQLFSQFNCIYSNSEIKICMK